MNRREKQLAIATAVLVTVWLISLITGRDPDHAEAAGPTTLPASTPASSTSIGVAHPPVGSTPSPTPAPAVVATSVEARLRQVSAVLAERATPSPPALFEDPFRELAPPRVRVRADDAARPPDLPQVGGLFLSEANCGALLDGHVCFVGERLRGFILSAVSPAGITLERDGRRFEIEYRPGDPQPSTE